MQGAYGYLRADRELSLCYADADIRLLQEHPEVAQRLRPAGHDMPPEMRAQAMAPEAVGPIVVRGIRGNRLTILTHPELVIPMVEARFEAIRADGEAELAERSG